MSDNAETAARAGFDEIAALAAQERKLHPDHEHFRAVDTALEPLRVNVNAYLGAAKSAESIGNTTEAEHLRARAAIVVAQARPIWEARLEAAKTERDRVHRGIQEAQRQSMTAMLGVHPPGRGVAVKDAKRALLLRLDALACELSNGDEAAFNSVLDGMEAATKIFQSTIGVARRESRLRVSEELARAAVSAVSAGDPPAEAA